MPSLSDIFLSLSQGQYTQFPSEPIPGSAFLAPQVTPGSPVLSNLPKSVASYERLQAGLDPVRSAVGPEALSAFNRLQAQRLARGQSPSSLPESLELLAAGRTLEAQNPTPDDTSLSDIPGNVLSDVKDIFRSIPKLPWLVADQVKQLPDAPAALTKALSSGDLTQLQQVPGINLIPGVYVGSNVLEGNWSEIAKHPLMNFLDALPAAQAKILPGTLRETRPYTRNPALHMGRRFTPTEAVVSPMVEEAAQAINTTPRFTGRKLQQAEAEFAKGQPQPGMSITELVANHTRVGPWLDRARMFRDQSRTGQFFSQALGEPAKNISSEAAHSMRMVEDILDPNSPSWRDVTAGHSYRAAVDRADAQLAEWMADPSKPMPKLADLSKRALPDLFELRERYLNPETAMGPGGYANETEMITRRRELTKRIQVESVDDVLADPTVTEFERGMIRDTLDVADKIIEGFTAPSLAVADPAVHAFVRVNMGGVDELLPLAQARRHHVFLSRYQAADQAAQLLDDAPVTTELVRFLNDPLIDRSVKGARADILRARLSRAVARGDDPALLVRDLQAAGLGDAEMLGITRDFLRPAGLTVDDIVSTYKVRRPGRVSVPEVLGRFHGAMELGHYTEAYRYYRDSLMKSKTRLAQLPDAFKAIPADQMKAALEVAQEATDATARAEALAATRTKARNAFMGYEKRAASARFYPKFAELAHNRMVQFADALTERMGTDPALAEQLAEQVRGGHYALIDDMVKEARAKGVTKAELADVFPRAREGTLIPPSVDELFRTFAGDARSGWMAMRDAGFEPGFVHKVSSDKALGGAGRILPRPTTPSQVKARTLDMTPLADDMSLAVEHQAMEWVAKVETDKLIDRMVHGDPQAGITAFTTTRAELEQYLYPEAERRAMQHGTTTFEEMQRMIQRQFVEFNPNELLNFPRQSVAHGAENLLIDRAMFQTLKRLAEPPKVNVFFDPAMKVFRTSVLTLSPRWQLYNLLGNGLMMAMTSGASPLKHMGEARDILRYLKDPEGMARPEAMAKLSESFRLSLSQMPRQMAELSYRSGEEWARRAGSQTRRAGLGETAAQLSNKFEDATQFLIKANGKVDDAYRIMVYLDRYEKSGAKNAALRTRFAKEKGVALGELSSRVDAEAAVRRFMYSWDEMTPFERQTMRMIFPFYGFMSHVMRFAYRYAIDHPVRLAVTAAFARTELEDWKDGLPERLRGMYMSDPKAGVNRAWNMAGWNPFADVANMMTLSGLLSQANPVISTIAEQFGIDPRTGEANLYPDSVYDPETGRLTLAPRNAALSLVENLIPQTQVLTGALGANKDLASLAQSDPDAYRRMQLTAFGVPTLTRDVDLSLEAMKAEGARRNTFRQGLSDAMAAPDSPSKYPVLRELQSQILQLQSNNPTQLSPYTPAGVADIQRGIVTRLGAQQ